MTDQTISPDFPLMNPFQATSGGGTDAYVAKLNATGSALVYSTYLGGGGFERITDIVVDASGNAYLTGVTGSPDFPTVGSIQAYGGSGDGFVTKLNAAGSALVYSTYLGGSGRDRGLGIVVGTSGNAYVSGRTRSTDFPTVSAFQTAHGGGILDAFATKLNAAGSAMVYSTYLGGSARDIGEDIAVDAFSNAYVAGGTFSADFPTVSSIQAFGGVRDAFVTKLNPTGSALIYSTYLGGSGDDGSRAIAVSASGVYLTGNTGSTDFPTVSAFDVTLGGGEDGFVAKFVNRVASIDLIWPPNHKMVDVEILGVSGPLTITITGITQDEPVNDTGDGNFEPDGIVVGTSTVQVRAERQGGKGKGKGGGSGNGRVYEISFIESDGQGATCPGSVTVCVPHDQGKKGGTCVDDGQLYNSVTGVPAAKPVLAGPQREGLQNLIPGDEIKGSPGVWFAQETSGKLNFELRQNAPNPFNPSTTIRYTLAEASDVRLTVYNSLGQRVRVLVNTTQSQGAYTAVWDGRDHLGREVSSGLYLYQLEAGANVSVRKMVFAK